MLSPLAVSFGLLVLVCLSGCTTQSEAVSLDGRPLVRPEIPNDRRGDLEAKLTAARADFEADPTDVDAIVWYGRRLAYLGRYSEAIDVYTEGLETHPREARLLRHRGHRYLTVRKPELAVADLEMAARSVRGLDDVVEQDGLPNAAGVPTTTLQFNIWYHLGLAYFVQQEWELALGAYRECALVSVLPDAVVAVNYWLCLTLARIGGAEAEAEIARLLSDLPEDSELYENIDYLRLLRMYRGGGEREQQVVWPGQGDDAVSSATLGFGVANFHRFFSGGEADRSGSEDLFVTTCRAVVDRTGWAAFGHLAAEAELVAEGAL